jgi:DNA-binding transcriptional MerR regulator
VHPDRHCRIGEVAKILDEEPHVIRFWDAQFGLKPLRSKSGHRVYTQAMVEKLIVIRGLLRGDLYTIAGAKVQLEAAARRLGK